MLMTVLSVGKGTPSVGFQSYNYLSGSWNKKKDLIYRTRAEITGLGLTKGAVWRWAWLTLRQGFRVEACPRTERAQHGLRGVGMKPRAQQVVWKIGWGAQLAGVTNTSLQTLGFLILDPLWWRRARQRWTGDDQVL